MLLLIVAPAANAQPCPAGWLPGQGIPGVNGSVHAVVVLPDGDVLVGGNFTVAAGVAVHGIARYSPAGNAWSTLGGTGSGVSGGSSSVVYALALLPDGDVIVAGTFTSAGGVPANHIARYSPVTGAWSALGTGLSNTVSALAVLPNGDVLAGGSFTTAGGVAASNVARYNPGSGVWSALGFGVNFAVRALAALPDGDVIVGGAFSTAGGDVSAKSVARYNSASGAWSALGGVGSGVFGMLGNVSALLVLPGGDVIVGGSFSTAGNVATGGNVSAPNIARYSPSSDTWSALGGPGLGIGSGATLPVRSLALLSDGDVVVGGEFNAAGGMPAQGIARYSPGSGAWSAPAAGVSAAYTLGVLPGGEVIVGGRTDVAGSLLVRNIASYGPDAGTWSALGTGVIRGSTPAIFALVAPAGTDVIAGGNFSVTGAGAVRFLGRYNPAAGGGTGGSWTALGTGVSGRVNALAVLPNEDLVAGGQFTTAGGVLAVGVARYSPASSTWSSMGTSVIGGPVLALAVLPGGDVIMGGSFTSATVPASGVARYSPATNSWSALGSGVGGSVSALAVLPGGDLIVGGRFTTAGGVAASNVARYSPASGSWSALGPPGSGAGNAFSSVSAVAVLPGGDVIVGGSFVSASGVAALSVARYNPSSNSWSALGPAGSGVGSPSGTVSALAVLPDGDVIVGGSFSTAGGVAAGNIARYSPRTNSWSSLGVGVDGPVGSLAVRPNGRLVVGGEFTTAGGSVSAFLAEYTFGSACPADFDCSGVRDVSDIFGFLSAWFAGAASADVDGSGVRDVADIFAFLSLWFAGC